MDKYNYRTYGSLKSNKPSRGVLILDDRIKLDKK